MDLKNHDNNEGSGTEYSMARLIGRMADATGETGKLVFQTNNGSAGTGLTDAMTIMDDGNVGIGTSSPSEILHLSKSSGDAILLLEADTDDDNEGDNPSIQFSQDGGAISGFLGFEGTGGTLHSNSISNALTLGSTSNSPVQLYTNSIPRLTVLANGNLGIGMTNPIGMVSIVDIGNANPGIYLSGFGDSEGDIVVEEGEQLQIGRWDSGAGAGSEYSASLTVDTEGNLEIEEELQTAKTGGFHMLPIAMATIDGSDGSIKTSTGNISCSRNNLGDYTITVSGHTANFNNDIVTATVIGSNTGQISVEDSGSSFGIKTRTSAGADSDRDFSIIIYSKND